MKSTVALAVLLFAGSAAAQVGIEQAPAPDQQLSSSPDRANQSAVEQLTPTSADFSDAGISQTGSAASGRSPLAQVQRGPGDRDPRIPRLPPHLIDACTEAALGRRKAPVGIDCSKVVEADAPQRTAELSGDDALVSGARAAGNEVSIRRLEDADPEEIARRLASGYLVNAPAAQAVGSNEQQQPSSGVVVIPDPARGQNAPPPAIVNPSPR